MNFESLRAAAGDMLTSGTGTGLYLIVEKPFQVAAVAGEL